MRQDKTMVVGSMARLLVRRMSRLLLFAFPVLLILSFQNCSGGSGEDGISAVSGVNTSATSDRVGVIDEVNPLKDWALAKPSVEVENSVDSLVLDGLCQRQEDGRMNWRLEAARGGVIVQGTSVCLAGRFAIDLSPLATLPCGESAHLVGSIGAKERRLVEVVRRCRPEVAFEVVSLKQSLVPAALSAAAAACQVEILGSDCQHVCYGEDGQVVHKTAMTGDLCAADHQY